MRAPGDISPKVTAAAVATAAVGLVLWLLDAYLLTPGVEGDLPPAVVLFLTTAGAFAAGYFRADDTPSRYEGEHRKN